MSDVARRRTKDRAAGLPVVPWAILSVRAFWERPVTLRTLVCLVVAAIAMLVAAFEIAVRPVDAIGGSDVTAYEAYGSNMLDGELPYRDFPMEYPPGASPMFVLPATRLLAGGPTEGASWFPPNAPARRYYRAFTSLVLVLLAAIVVLTALTLRQMRRPARTVVLSLAVVASSPLLLERVLTERFDVWPAALTSAALALSVRGHYRSGGALVGLGAAAKIYPVLLLPVLVIAVVRLRGVREATFVAAAAMGAAAAVFMPFAIASFSETWEAVRIQFGGGLHIETTASSVLVMTRHAAELLTTLGLPSPPALTTKGAGGELVRTNLAGTGVEATRVVMNALLVTALCLLWITAARSREDPREDLLRYAAATVAVVLVLGTVLSPQYLDWLIPLVPLVGGRRGAAAMCLFVVAAILTNVWIPDQYFEFQDSLLAGQGALLLARNLALLATALVLILPARVLPHWHTTGGRRTARSA